MSEPTRDPGNTRAAQKADVKIFTLKFFYRERKLRAYNTYHSKTGRGTLLFWSREPILHSSSPEKGPISSLTGCSTTRIGKQGPDNLTYNSQHPKPGGTQQDLEDQYLNDDRLTEACGEPPHPARTSHHSQGSLSSQVVHVSKDKDSQTEPYFCTYLLSWWIPPPHPYPIEFSPLENISTASFQSCIAEGHLLSNTSLTN